MATHRSAKRAKTSHPWDASKDLEYPAVSEAFLQQLRETDWDTAIASWQVENAPPLSGGAISSQSVFDGNIQRIDAEDLDPNADGSCSEVPTLDSTLQVAPVTSANVPKPQSAIISLNPFMLDADQIAARYDPHKRKVHIFPVGGRKRVDSYIKFDWNPAATTGSFTMSLKRKALDDGRHVIFNPQHATVNHQQAMVKTVPLVPPNFGRAHKPDRLDLRLLAFYETAFCKGRTLLDRTNAYHDFMTMTDSSDCVRHCALALAAGYMLDYVPNHHLLRQRVNFHYSQAVSSLSDFLADPTIQGVGKEDAAVAALVLLFSDDIVNWELREKGDKNPKWRQGSKVAKKILDASDPGLRYWKSENVQLSRIRASNANMVAYTEICALPVTPLEVEDADKLYTWLMGGSERDVHQIHGGTGVSPRLLYVYAQITNLAARFEADPDSNVIPLFAEEIKRRLNRFRQWSELDTEGYDDVTALLASCQLDDDGLVQSHATVTNLTGETWVQGAKIYLYCRFFRFPPYKKEVQESLGLLLRCLERMPTSGRSFTAQSPFFCIVLAALVAQKDSDRQVIRNWFEAIVSSASPRSSVPPIWTIVQEYWDWFDEQPFADPRLDPGDYVPLKHRRPWWEEMVKRFMDTEGQLSLV